MNNTVIKVEEVGKLYKLGEIGTGTISHDLNRWLARLRGKEDPFAKIGQTNDRTAKGTNDWVWALKDLNFEVKQGEVLGIIGRNGAGKSTLLKILSKVTSPSSGKIKVKGRIASLLEVGTGFHPELTGRENIFLNGAILGMTKREIKNKFDEIVDFSGVERYIDTPVKRYSSGMYVRLAFAVAAFLEPEILIIDEVLAVGDAEFQKKCLGKMGEVSKSGRTVLFVSHNLPSVKQLCSRAILLNNGQLIFSGTSQETISKYLEVHQNDGLSKKFEKIVLESKDVQLIKAELLDIEGNSCDEFDISDQIRVDITIHCIKKVPDLYGYITVMNTQEELLIETDTLDLPPNVLENLKEGNNNFTLIIREHVLAYGEYTFYISFTSSFGDGFLIDVPGNILKFSISDNKTIRRHRRTSKTSHLIKWNIRQ